MNVSILHISDLHRDPSHEIANPALLRSLQSDRLRYQSDEDPISSPQLIVVSGDIVQGVSRTTAEPLQKLAAQYEQAEEFLATLADEFLEGDRDRVVIVPGNHDISMYHVHASLTQLSVGRKPATIADYVSRCFQPNSSIRWSWQDLSFYEIANSDVYDARLEAFATFYARFYRGTKTYSLDPKTHFALFDYPQFGTTFVGFSSCFNNDPLNKQARIHPAAIAAAAAELRHARYAGRLLVSVWHHNTSGGPSDVDYLDADVLQVLMDCGFSIGLHGHQHKTQFIDERFLFGSSQKLTVISAGTLCGGKRALPQGHARSYNILTIDTEGLSGVLHQRRMLNNDLASPVWAPGWFPSSGRSSVSFQVQRPVSIRNDFTRLAEAERLVANEEYESAKFILRPLARTNGLARRMLLECHTSHVNPHELIADLFPPVSSAEAIHLADALWEIGDRPHLRMLLEGDLVSRSTDPAILEIRTKYTQRLAN